MLRKLNVVWAFAILISIPNCSNEPPVTDCDKLAASPADPQRKVAGILIEKINPDLAISACVTAVHQYPTAARLNFQLGRAYFKAKKYESAVDQYRKAAEQGYVTAQFNLGVLYEYGLGVRQDYGQALVWYRKAAEQGDQEAKIQLNQLS